MNQSAGFPIFLFLLLANHGSAAPRDIQIRSINFQSGQIELVNFGSSTADLSGFRCCSHDEDQVRNYTNASGMNGKSIAPHEALFIHFNNDAPPGDPKRINRSSLGGSFATPLDVNGSYGLSLYFPPVDFANGATMADHIQWSYLGLDDPFADERSDEAEAGGLWIDQNQWIATNTDSHRIILVDGTGAPLHSPSDYLVVGPAQPPPLIESSSFTPSTMQPGPSGTFSITWTSTPGSRFVIESSTDLRFWVIIEPDHPAGGTVTQFHQSTFPSDPRTQFYRVWRK